MTRRLVLLAVIALALAVCSNGMLVLAYLGNGAGDFAGTDGGFLNSFLIVNSFGSVFAGATVAALVGVMAFFGQSARRPYRVLVPVLLWLVGAVSLILIGGSWVTSTVSDLMLYSDGPPFDWFGFLLGVGAIVLFLAAATLYSLAVEPLDLRLRDRLGAIGLLVLSILPLLNIAAAIGMLVTILGGRHRAVDREVATPEATDMVH